MGNALSQTAEIKQKAASSIKWAFLANLLPKAISPIVMVILARLLLPSDYGIIGMSLVVVGLANLFHGMGLSQALIQCEKDMESAADVAFWSNVTLGVFMATTIVLLAPWISSFFHEPRLSAVLRVQSIAVIISSLASVQNAFLQRKFKFKKLMGLTLVPSLMPLIVAVPLALHGFGYWALVGSAIAGRGVQTFLLWKYSSWRPRWRYDIRIARQMLTFGGLVALEGLIGWAMISGDNLVAGHFMSSEDVGLYVFGFNLVVLLVGFFVNPLTGVAYSAFSRLQSDIKELKRIFLESTRMIATIVIPFSFGLSLIADPFTAVVLGSRWHGIEPVIRILAISPALSFIWNLNPSLYKAINRPDLMPKIHLAQVLYIAPTYWIAAQYGLNVFCWARASVIVFLLFHIMGAVKVLKLPFNYFWNCIRTPLFAGLIMALVVYLMENSMAPYTVCDWLNILKLLGIIMCGAVSYGLSLWFIDKELCMRFLQVARKIA
jgi:PST family polysaccharide transporter